MPLGGREKNLRMFHDNDRKFGGVYKYFRSVGSPFCPTLGATIVIPAKAGIQGFGGFEATGY